MTETVLNFWAVMVYCRRFPHPWWKYPWVCWHVYRWRREIGIITPMKLTGFWQYWICIFKGINSYGHWLRQPYGSMEGILENRKPHRVEDKEAR